MKKKFLALLLMSTVLFTACQSENAPTKLVDDIMNVGINNVEIESATAQIGVSGQELRDTFIAWTEESLTAIFTREEETAEEEISDEEVVEPAENDNEETTNETQEEIIDEEATDEPQEEVADEETTDETQEEIADEEAADEIQEEIADETQEEAAEEYVAAETHPLVKELAKNFLDKMQETVSYKTKIMSLSKDTALVKVSVIGLDTESYYTKYMEMLTELSSETTEETTDEEYLELASKKFKDLIDIVKPASTPVEFYVSLTKSGDNWNVDDVSTLVQQIYTMLMV